MLLPLTEGLSLIYEYRLEILFLLLGIWAGGICIINTGILKDLHGLFRYIGVFCLGFLLLSGATFLIAFLSLFSRTSYLSGCYIISIFAALLIIKSFITSKNKTKILVYAFETTTLFLISLAVHLPYLNRIILPSYSDSPIHYQIIQQILFPSSGAQSKLAIKNILDTYYHFGYHGITAWLAASSNSSIERSMSFIGQISLALIPMSIATAVFMSTKSKWAALCSGMLASLGWLMPSFALNWGKFPALMAISTMPIILNLGTSIINEKIKERATTISFGLLLSCSAITHTRAIVLIILFGIAVIFISKLKLPEKFEVRKSIIYSFLFLITLSPFLNNISIFFNNPIIGVALLFFLPFAFRNYPKEISGLFIFIASIWILEFILYLLSIKFSSLDTQFISIYLFIPFSMIGGLGIAGAMEVKFTKLKLFFPLTLILITIFSSPWEASLAPDPCCTYYTQDDQNAFNWIQQNTSDEDLFIISVIENTQSHGTDAGIWIHPLTNRHTNKVIFNTTWKESIINTCNSGKSDIYIYAGGHQYSFSKDILSKLNWVEAVFEQGKIKMFKVIKCAKSNT
ncbi:MAG: hypothetical protein U0V18_17555 [Anaerolineales bacterium]